MIFIMEETSKYFVDLSEGLNVRSPNPLRYLDGQTIGNFLGSYLADPSHINRLEPSHITVFNRVTGMSVQMGVMPSDFCPDTIPDLLRELRAIKLRQQHSQPHEGQRIPNVAA